MLFSHIDGRALSTIGAYPSAVVCIVLVYHEMEAPDLTQKIKMNYYN